MKFISPKDVRAGDTIVWNTDAETYPVYYMTVKEIEEGETTQGNPAVVFIGKRIGVKHEESIPYPYPLAVAPDKFWILLIDRKE
jgi:hypothetical protein